MFFQLAHLSGVIFSFSSSSHPFLLCQSLGYRTLASMTSLILGFFACASSTTSSSPSLSPSPSSSIPPIADYSNFILSTLRQSSFIYPIDYIQQFLLLQSDSQLLQQDGLETTFKMVEALKRIKLPSPSTHDHQEGDDNSNIAIDAELTKAEQSTNELVDNRLVGDSTALSGRTFKFNDVDDGDNDDDDKIDYVGEESHKKRQKIAPSSSSSSRFDQLFGSQFKR